MICADEHGFSTQTTMNRPCERRMATEDARLTRLDKLSASQVQIYVLPSISFRSTAMFKYTLRRACYGAELFALQHKQ